MAAVSGVAGTQTILTEKEEKQLSKLRERLFESNWDSAEFKASLRDLVSVHVIVRAERG